MGMMKLEQYVVGPVQTNCFFVINDESKEMIIIRIIKVDYNGLLFFRLSVWLLNSHRNPITDHEILLFVDLKQ